MRKIILLLGDIAILYIALYATLFIRYGSEFSFHINEHFIPFSINFVLWLVIFFIAGLYDTVINKNTVTFYQTSFYALLVSAVVGISSFYLVPYFGITPKTNFFIFLVLLIALFIPWRMLYNKLLQRSSRGNNTLFLGASSQSQYLYEFLLAHPQAGYNAIGILDINDKDGIAILEKLITSKNITTLVLDREAYSIPDITNILYRLLKRQINFYNLSDFYEEITGTIPLESLDQSWFLRNLNERNKRVYEFTSRAFDILFSIPLAIVTLVLMPFVALAIKSDSSGPVFIRQKRIGKAGHTFTLVKFRSMIANMPDGSAEGETGPMWTQKDDPRITRVGKLLRKTKIDELPQVWNVLNGELSWVGPRSERPEFHDQLKGEIPFYEERYLVKPGVTGWAQIHAGYGGSIRGSKNKIKYDLYYIKHRSLFLDIGIILKTLNIMARKAGI